MVHSGYEATAVAEAVRKPWKMLRVELQGVRTEGPMAPEISLEHQRPAEYVFSRHVQESLEQLKHAKPAVKNLADAAD
jgi:hypothetical protein